MGLRPPDGGGRALQPAGRDSVALLRLQVSAPPNAAGEESSCNWRPRGDRPEPANRREPNTLTVRPAPRAVPWRRAPWKCPWPEAALRLPLPGGRLAAAARRGSGALTGAARRRITGSSAS